LGVTTTPRVRGLAGARPARTPSVQGLGAVSRLRSRLQNAARFALEALLQLAHRYENLPAATDQPQLVPDVLVEVVRLTLSAAASALTFWRCQYPSPSFGWAWGRPADAARDSPGGPPVATGRARDASKRLPPIKTPPPLLRRRRRIHDQTAVVEDAARPPREALRPDRTQPVERPRIRRFVPSTGRGESCIYY
jgi:hypothetical protein